MHPSAPEDLPGLVDAFAHTIQAVADLAATCSDKDFDKPTDCPGWSVKDQVSHVVAMELHLLGRGDPAIDVPEYEHVRGSIGAMMENGVELRRPRAGKEVATELERLIPERVGRLRDPSLTLDTEVPGLRRPGPLGDVLRVRISDVWCHEQDIRTALARPGNLDSPAAAVWVETILNALPEIVVERAKIEPGRVVMIELTGPIIARSGVRVDTDDNGAPVGRLMFSGGSDETGPIPAIGKTTSLQLSTEAFARRGAGRRPVADLRYSVHGDEEVARRVLEALSIAP